jgi:hypothetical protein
MRFRPIVFSLLVACLILISCLPAPPLPPPLVLPTPLPNAGPNIPFRNPNLRGVAETHILPVANTDELEQCLANGQTIYGIALQNTNVRISPDVDACRVGRIPRGTLVQVTGSLKTQEIVAAQVVSRPVSITFASTLGFVEDIRPIFRRTCNSCHSAVVKNLGLQVTEYAPLLKGSTRGQVVIPGDPSASVLWQQLESGKMPLVGQLPADDKQLIRDWIEAGAPERRTLVARETAEAPIADVSRPSLWLRVDGPGVNPVAERCTLPSNADKADKVVSSELLYPLSCGVAPRPVELRDALKRLNLPLPLVDGLVASTGGSSTGAAALNAPVRAVATNRGDGSQGALRTATLGLPPATDEDGWLQPRGGFCVEQHLPQNVRGITALAFAPNGALYMALDLLLTDEPDPLILYDAHHPSRSVAIYDPVARTRPRLIFDKSSRITGMVYANGGLFLNRAGEVGYLSEGGEYEPLAGGFAVNSQLFHANNGIAIADGWLYVSAGGVIDGYSDGPIVGIPESAAQSVVSGGNRFAARLVRAPVDALLSQRSIEVFQTAARGLRNPYGLTVDPSGRLWFTDNGATNVPENVSAGDEVNFFDPNTVAPGTAEETTPHFGFPLALNGAAPDWYSRPVVALPNTSAPTSITWAYGTLFFGAYGRDPGLYRLGRTADGQIVGERIMLVWPLLATATAPDGALWIGTGGGGLFRMTPGC